MTPLQKAKDLVERFKAFNWATSPRAKRCALKVVDEILNLDVWDYQHNAEYGKLFWEQVKHEIIHSL